MKLILRQIALPPDAPEKEAEQAALKKLKAAGISAYNAKICRVSVDGRKKNDIKFVYSVTAECIGASDRAIYKAGAEKLFEPDINVTYGKEQRHGKIAVIGFGPAGIFAALMLAENGYGTVIYERGKSVSERAADIEKFKADGILDTESNVQFGAGGAGTFSDGKLITRINDPACSFVLKRLAGFGAPENILTDARPHIGTDILQTVISNVTDHLLSRGVQIRFESKVEKISESLKGISIRTADGEEYYDAAVLAAGHSARDTYKMLYSERVKMEKKPFSVGCRIEHLQSDIDAAMYGEGLEKYREFLPHAEYNLSFRENGRGVYSFCMCPGGRVICASTERDGIVTNGMSCSKRDGKNANSAIAVSVMPEDLPADLLSGIDFQRSIERAAFSISGRFSAPVQTLDSFLYGGKNEITKIVPTFKPSVITAEINNVFPSFITDFLKKGLYEFDKKIKGFADKAAVLTAPETRTSSPLRILRNGEYFSDSIPSLYPCGEGAGYAGGITSAAADGINTACKIMSRFKPDK